MLLHFSSANVASSHGYEALELTLWEGGRDGEQEKQSPGPHGICDQVGEDWG